MFELRDPRLGAISQAGANFGGGLSDALVQYINNRRLNQASSQIQPNTSIKDAIGIMARNNLSPEYMNMLLSPTVQNRQAQERAAGIYENLGRMSPDELRKIPFPQLISQFAAAAALTPEGFRGIAPIAEAFRNYAQTQNVNNENLFGNPNIEEPNTTQSSPSGSHVEPPRSSGRYFNGGLTEPVTMTPRGGFNQEPAQVPRIGETNIRPNMSDIYNDIKSYMRVTPDAKLPDALKYAADKFQIEESAIQRMYQQQEKQEAQRQAVIDERNRITHEADKFIAKDYSDQDGNITLPTEMRNLLVDKMIEEEKGTDQQRYTKANKFVTDLQDRIRGLGTGSTRPFLGKYRPEALQGYIKQKQGEANAILNDKRLPDIYKPFIREKMRTVLSNMESPESRYLTSPFGVATTAFMGNARNLGPVEIEEIVNEPSKQMRGALKVIPKPTDDPEKNFNNLVNFWAKTAGGMDSPLYGTQMLIDKGYDKEQITSAFDAAQAQKANFSEYQLNQRNQYLNREFVPSLKTIFGIDPSTRGLYDVGISGSR